MWWEEGGRGKWAKGARGEWEEKGGQGEMGHREREGERKREGARSGRACVRKGWGGSKERVDVHALVSDARFGASVGRSAGCSKNHNSAHGRGRGAEMWKMPVCAWCVYMSLCVSMPMSTVSMCECLQMYCTYESLIFSNRLYM